MNTVVGGRAGVSGVGRRGRVLGGAGGVVMLARVVLALVAGFWGWFVAMVVVGEGWGSVGPAVAIGGPLVVVAGMAWVWPRWAGVVAVVCGIAAWVGFDHWTPRALMALPLVVAGAGLVWGAWVRRGRGAGGRGTQGEERERRG